MDVRAIAPDMTFTSVFPYLESNCPSFEWTISKTEAFFRVSKRYVGVSNQFSNRREILGIDEKFSGSTISHFESMKNFGNRQNILGIDDFEFGIVEKY